MTPVGDLNLEQLLINVDDMSLKNPDRNKARANVLRWSCCLIKVMEYLHKNGIRHKDIKPSNILIKDEDVYLVDFGISKVIPEGETTGTYGPVGAHSRVYCAPEVYFDEYPRRGRSADVYSMGCVFLELSTAILGPPRSRQKLAHLRNSEFETAYAANPKIILKWILFLWVYWLEAALADSGYDLLTLEAISVLDLAFLMLDPNPNQRITAQQLVDMMIQTKDRRYNRIYDRGCYGCRSDELPIDFDKPLHSKFKPRTALKYPSSPEHALKTLPAEDWEATKRAWLQEHMWWPSEEEMESNIDG